jgi:coproporphyrinogen III oxidase
MTALAPEIQDRRARAKAWFESLQQRICAELERLEEEAPVEL